MKKKQYWVRFCGSFPAFDSKSFDNLDDAKRLVSDCLPAVNFSFAYIMSTDPFGPYFQEIIRRGELERAR